MRQPCLRCGHPVESEWDGVADIYYCPSCTFEWEVGEDGVMTAWMDDSSGTMEIPKGCLFVASDEDMSDVGSEA